MLTTYEGISPADLDILCALFKELLEECHLSRDSDDAEFLAAKLISIYQSGVRDPVLVKTLAIPFMRRA